ncbi:MAG: hypothetical protein KJ844_11490, partial [Candidatus Edwardsbacteria bacterium]|nr:hypothetical protein [Candidatus Edwardsbacteria bacterium]
FFYFSLLIFAYNPLNPSFTSFLMDSLQRTNYPDLENTVLSILSADEKPSSDLDEIFSNKTKVLKSTIKQLFNEINLRFQVDKDIFQSITDDICACYTFLEEVKLHVGRGYDMEMVLSLMPRRSQLETQIFDLKKQKRTEALECWRDMMIVKKYLMMALSEYWKLSKRQQLLSSDLIEDKENEHN